MRYHEDSGINLFSSDDRLADLRQLGDPLLALSRHIDFEFFRTTLERGLYESVDQSKGGRPPFDPVLMFKILVLQRLYNLSDDAVEFQIKDRLTFMALLGLDFASRVPDAKTVWLFRDRLQQHGLVEELFDQLNAHLEARGIIANKGQIVDASFVDAPRQRNNRDENEAVKRGETPESWGPHKKSQKDVEARWSVKNKETHFGYKNHVLCDRKSKLLKKYAVTDGARHDSTALDELLADGGADGQKLYGAAAYPSEEALRKLNKRRIKCRFHEKAQRGRPLLQKQLDANRRKSRLRARVEHVFGFMTQSMCGMAVRAKSLARNGAVIGMLNLTYNLCRVVQLQHKIRVAGG